MPAFGGKAFAAIVVACTGVSAPPAIAAPSDPAPPSGLAHNPGAADRAWIAAQIYHTVRRYFAHWEGLPADYDWDAHFRAYLSEALAAPDRRSFSLATMRLVASLNNGHSGFTDEALYADPRPAPFYAEPIGGRWTVRTSRAQALAPGAVIVAIDNVPIQTWVVPVRALIGESNERARDSGVFYETYMLPDRFTLTLTDGRRIAIDRGALGALQGRTRAKETITTLRPDGTVVIAIPSFGDPKFEDAAVAAVRAHMDAPLILFDVRGNGGGNSPGKLGAAMMDRPYTGTVVTTPFTVAEFDAHGSFDPGDNPLPKAMIRYCPDVTQPVPGAFSGRAALLIDRHCASACEDFAIRFKTAHRGSILGEATLGSTGQPYKVAFADLGMQLRVSTKRESFPDGSRFEGVGVTPDIAVPPVASDFASTGDPQLERAIASALAAQVRR